MMTAWICGGVEEPEMKFDGSHSGIRGAVSYDTLYIDSSYQLPQAINPSG